MRYVANSYFITVTIIQHSLGLQIWYFFEVSWQIDHVHHGIPNRQSYLYAKCGLLI